MPALELLKETFTLVSAEGDEFPFPVYELMTWSKGFRDLIAVGDGEKKVQLTESSVTLQLFKELLAVRTFNVKWSSNTTNFDQVLDLARFIDKYECEFVVKDFLATVKRNAGVCWPPLLLFMSGVIMARPEICAAALNRRAYPWSNYAKQWRPKDLKSEEAYCLHPVGIPASIRNMIPVDYLLALALANGQQNATEENRSGRCAERFKEELQKLEDDRKPADDEPAKKKVKRTAS